MTGKHFPAQHGVAVRHMQRGHRIVGHHVGAAFERSARARHVTGVEQGERFVEKGLCLGLRGAQRHRILVVDLEKSSPACAG